MKPIYKKLLKKLKKGNAVLLEAEGSRWFPRYRLVTPNNCEYMLPDLDGKFRQSCFINSSRATPLGIIARMEKFDRQEFMRITKMQELK